MTLLEVQISEKLKSLKLKTKNGYFKRWFVFIGCGCFLIIVFTVLTVVIHDENWKGGLFALRELIIMMTLFALIIYLVLNKKMTKKFATINSQKLATLGAELHQIWFDHNRYLFPRDFQFEGIKLDEFFQKNSLYFSLRENEIIYTLTGSKRNKTNKNFPLILEFNLFSTSKKISDFEQFFISEENDFLKDKKLSYESESILFNQRFNVEGMNHLQISKLLTPKIIDNFLKQSPDLLNLKVIEIKNNLVKVNAKQKVENPVSWWTPDPLDFSQISWFNKKIVPNIIEKITLDFQYYLEVQKILDPLELYTFE